MSIQLAKRRRRRKLLFGSWGRSKTIGSSSSFGQEEEKSGFVAFALERVSICLITAERVWNKRENPLGSNGRLGQIFSLALRRNFFPTDGINSRRRAKK